MWPRRRCGHAFTKKVLLTASIVIIIFLLVRIISSLARSDTIIAILTNSEAIWTSQATQSASFTKDANSPKLLLMWTPFFWERLESVFQPKYLGDCPCGHSCTISSDQRQLVNASAIIFHARNVNFSTLPAYRSPEQLWVLFNLESPQNANITQKYDDLFNLTMTYRSDSDIPFPYGHYERSPHQPLLVDKISENLSHRRAAYILVSNCNSQRRRYIKEIAKYLDVDVFGLCTNLTPCARADVACENSLSSSYAFYLAFENSRCEQYITEKLWRTLKSPGGAVPIVMGAPLKDCQSLAPPNSFIHVENFTSTHNLGKFLQKVMSDRESFKYYNRWREHFTAYGGDIDEFPRATCSLCCALHNKHRPRSTTAKNVSRWFNSPCQSLLTADQQGLPKENT